VQPSTQQIQDRVRALLEGGDEPALGTYLNGLHPADIAELMGRLEPDEQQSVLRTLDRHAGAEVIEHAAEDVRTELLEDLDDKEVSAIVEEMHAEEAADILGELPEERAEHVLELMADSEAEEVEGLLRYPPDTAGGIMAPVLARVRDDVKVAQVLAMIQSDDELQEEEIYKIYVVDSDKRVIGSVPLWTLLRARPGAPVRDVIEDIQTIPADMDQEQVARVFAKYDLEAAPVVDRSGRLLGRITFDDIHDVLEEEQSEDISRFAGTDDDELTSSSALTTARLRLPWLIVCLVGTLFAGLVIHHYDQTLTTHFILMMFIPAVMATAGNSGLQTATMTVRSMATGHADRVGATALINKQIRTAVVIALVCGIVAGCAAAVWGHFSPRDHLGTGDAALLGLIIGGSMFAAICVSCTMGVAVPFAFRNMGIDPAVASGPLIMTCTDIFSLMVYLGVAKALLESVPA
jgi:magnesium transporter